MTDNETLQALIRLLPPVRALKEQLEQSIFMETYRGIGDTAIRNYTGLHAAVIQIVNDPYLESLALELPHDADDREKVSLVLLNIAQLSAYIEGQTGLVNFGDGGSRSFQTAPNINISLENVDGVGTEAIIDAIKRMLKN